MRSGLKSEQGQVLLGMSRALADDVRKMVNRATAPERTKNPTLMNVVGTAAAGIVFFEFLAEAVKEVPENKRALFRAKLIEMAENEAAGLPTPPFDMPN